jgi:hypothetical protein
MAGSLIGALRVSLSAETSSFEAGMKRAQRTTATATGGIAKSLGRVKGLIAGFTGALALGGLTAAIKSSLEYASHLTELGETLGLTAKDLQTFSFAAGQVGVAQEELENGIQKLTISMGKAQVGSQAQVKAFKAIGISIDEIKGKNTGDVFRLIAEKLQNVTDRSQRAAVEVALFGKAGAKLDNLLSGAEGKLSELTDAAEKLGIVLSEDEIRNADRTADKLQALQTVLKADIAKAVADNADGIFFLVNALAKLVGIIPQAIKGWSQFLSIEAAGAKALLNGQNPAAAMRDRGSQFRNDSLSARFAGDRAAISLGKSGGVNVGNFLAGGDKKAKEDHSAEDALRAEHDFNEALSRANIDILNAKKDLAADYIEQTTIAIQIKDAEKAAFDQEQAYKVELYKLTKGKQGQSQVEADQLKALYDSRDALERQAILDQETAHRQKDTQDLIQSDFDRRRDVLDAQSSIAETASERRKVELDILELAYQQKRQALQNVIDTDKDGAAIENARRDLLNLNRTHAADRQNVIQSTRGPLEDYLASLPMTAAKANEALQRLEVDGFEGFIDSVLALSDGVGKATDSLLATVKQFVLGLARLELQRGLGSLFQSSGGIGGLLRGLVGGSSAASGGSFSTALSIPGVNAPNLPGYASGGGSLPVFASGGSGIFKGIPGIDRNVLSLNGLPIARVSHGEHFSIDPVNDRGGGRIFNQHINIQTRDADSFRKSETQIARQARRHLRLD